MATNYQILVAQARGLLENEPNALANAANFASLLYHELGDVNWAGFYFPEASGDLVLGPFNGRPACTRLPIGKGVCQAAFASGKTVRVDDVHAFDGHIACDSASQSEIVVPVIVSGKVRGVFDIDSPSVGRFSQLDEVGIETLVGIIAEKLDAERLAVDGD